MNLDRLLLLIVAGGLAGCATRPPTSTVSLQQDTQSVRWISATGQELLQYQLKPPMGSALTVESGCYFHPLKTPSGVTVTDVAPLDHRHHRGIFFAWLEVRGEAEGDFWGWGEYAPTKGRRIFNRQVEPQGAGRVKIRNAWVAEETVLLDEQLEAQLNPGTNMTVLDLTYTLTPKSDLKLSRWAFSGFSVRAPKHPIAVLSSEGKPELAPPNHMKPETDWPDRLWYAYTLTLGGGAQAGVAVFNHPSNPPSLWHNVTSIALLNPCVVAPGPMELKAGRPVVFRYRVAAFDGAADANQLNLLGQEFKKR